MLCRYWAVSVYLRWYRGVVLYRYRSVKRKKRQKTKRLKTLRSQNGEKCLRYYVSKGLCGYRDIEILGVVERLLLAVDMVLCG